MDVTAYLKTYVLSAKELAAKIIQDVLGRTGSTATAGIGTNLYLSKVAMVFMQDYHGHCGQKSLQNMEPSSETSRKIIHMLYRNGY